MGDNQFSVTLGFYKDGFFGYSDKTDFIRFSAAHFIPILILIAAVILLWIYRDRIRNCKNEKRIMHIIGFVLLFVEMSYYWRIMYVGPSWYDLTDLMSYLPVQVCEWTCLIAAVMMLTGNRTCFCICYFICMTLSWFALIFPTVIDQTGPAYYRYYQFWIEHILPMVSVFYMMFVHGYTVKLKDMIKPLVFLVVLMIPATYLNSVYGTNFMYLVPGGTGDPFTATFPDSIAGRILVYVIIAVGLFIVVWVPMHLNRKQIESFAEREA